MTEVSLIMLINHFLIVTKPMNFTKCTNEVAIQKCFIQHLSMAFKSKPVMVNLLAKQSVAAINKLMVAKMKRPTIRRRKNGSLS